MSGGDDKPVEDPERNVEEAKAACGDDDKNDAAEYLV
jgi:hypothetical protein